MTEPVVTKAMVSAAIGEHDPLVFKHGTPDAIREHMTTIILAALRLQWRPIAERDPDERGSFLVWCPERRNIYCVVYASGRLFHFESGHALQEVPTRFQPLPPAPTGDE